MVLPFTANDLLPPPEPPRQFSPLEQAVWRKIVADCPPGWFTPDVHFLLERLVFLIVWVRHMEADLRATEYRFSNALEENNYVEAQKLIGTIATKLRLTLQSRSGFGRKRAAKRIHNFTPAAQAPWENVQAVRI